MSKRVVFEEADSEFCHCDSPEYEPNEVHSQRGGEIVCQTIGYYCTNCGGWEPPKEENDEE